MAEGKKSFLLYCDLIHTVRKMPDEKAGQLLKHILEYVNDNNPETEDLLLQLVFEPIKQQLKRDLDKWSNISATRSEIGRLAGLKSGEARRAKSNQDEPNEPIGSETNQNEHVSDNVTVNVNDSDNVKDSFSKKKKKETLETYLEKNKEDLAEAFKDYPTIKEHAFKWLKYKFKSEGYKEIGWSKIMVRRIKETSIDFIKNKIDETIDNETGNKDYVYQNQIDAFKKTVPTVFTPTAQPKKQMTNEERRRA